MRDQVITSCLTLVHVSGLNRRKKLYPYAFPKTTVRNTLVFELSDVTAELPMSYTEGNYKVRPSAMMTVGDCRHLSGIVGTCRGLSGGSDHSTRERLLVHWSSLRGCLSCRPAGLVGRCAPSLLIPR
jgi:hypothetical protein